MNALAQMQAHANGSSSVVATQTGEKSGMASSSPVDTTEFTISMDIKSTNPLNQV